MPRWELAFFRISQLMLICIAISLSFGIFYSYRTNDYAMLVFCVIVVSLSVIIVLLLESGIRTQREPKTKRSD